MANPFALPYGGMTPEEIAESLKQNPGPPAEIGLNPANPIPLSMAPEGPSLMERMSQTIQGQQLKGNVPIEMPPDMPVEEAIAPPPAPSIPDSIRKMAGSSLSTVSPITKQYKPESSVDLGYGKGLDDKALAKAIDDQKHDQLLAILGKAGSSIGAGIAGVDAKKIDTSGYDAIAAMGKQGVDDIKTKRGAKDEQAKFEKIKLDLNNEKAMQDPNSPESRFFRQAVQAKYGKLGIQIPDNLPATKIKALGLDIKPEERTKYSNVTYEIPGVGPVIGRFNQGTGEIEAAPVKGQTGPVVRGYAPKIDPRTGEMTTTIDLMKTTKKQESDMKDDRGLASESFEPSVRQAKQLTDERKGYLGRTEKRRQALSSANKLETILADPDKMDMSAIKTQLPRLMGEVGNLNQMEQDAWTGAPDFYNKYNQKLQTFLTGEITPSNVLELKKLIGQMKSETEKSIESEAKNSANMLKDVAKIPAAWSEKQLGQYYGQGAAAKDAVESRWIGGIQYVRDSKSGGWKKAK